MDIKVSKKKEDARRDPLIETLLKLKTASSSHSRQLIVVGVVVLLAIGGAVIMTHMRRAALRRADKAFGQALIVYKSGETQAAIDELSKVATEHRGTPHGAYAAYLVGSLLLENARYEEAISSFEAASKGPEKAGFVPAAALEGLSKAYEGLGEYEKAIEYARRALEDGRLEHRAPALRWRLALLLKETRKPQRAVAYCEQLVQDSLAMGYHQKARNLLAELQVAPGGADSQG